MRARGDLGSLREPRVFHALRPAFRVVSGETFRVVHFSVQRDHLHLLAEADDRRALARGMHGLAIRIARAVNRVLERSGAVFADRYHVRDLPTPKAVRNGIVYVLANVRKHMRVAAGLDPCSSAASFDGWAGHTSEAAQAVPLERREDGGTAGPGWTAQARTWLLRVGWRRHGAVQPDEAPSSGRGGREAAGPPGG